MQLNVPCVPTGHCFLWNSRSSGYLCGAGASEMVHLCPGKTDSSFQWP